MDKLSTRSRTISISTTAALSVRSYMHILYTVRSYGIIHPIRKGLYEDFQRTFTHYESRNVCLQNIDNILRTHGLNCGSISLSIPTPSHLLHVSSYDQNYEKEMGKLHLSKLNMDQRKIVSDVLQAIDTDDSKLKNKYIAWTW